eukprot:7249969-Heterocapsa_arctica.AAC.1
MFAQLDTALAAVAHAFTNKNQAFPMAKAFLAAARASGGVAFLTMARAEWLRDIVNKLGYSKTESL